MFYFRLLESDDQLALGAPALALAIGLEDLVERELERGGNRGFRIGFHEDMGRGSQVGAVGEGGEEMVAGPTGDKAIELLVQDLEARVEKVEGRVHGVVGAGDLDVLAAGFEQGAAGGIEL